MAKSNRKISEKTKELFLEYGKTMGQRMKKAEAVGMLEKDFHLTQPEASVIFDFFDQDKNGEFSMWEYQHFYDQIGHRARAMMDLFNRLDDDHSGTLDLERTLEGLKELKKPDGSAHSEDELSMRLMAFGGVEKCLDRTKFINLMCCLRLDLPEDVNNHSSDVTTQQEK